MKIRAKLTLIFFSIVILVLTTVSLSIYFFSANYQELDFHRRLKNRATNVAKVLLEVKEVDADLLKRMEQNNPASLPNQYVIIYDSAGRTVYQSDIVQPVSLDTAFLKTIKAKKEIWVTEHMFEVIGFELFEHGSTFTVIAAASDVFGKDALNNLRNILIIIFLISLVLVSVLGWFYAGRVLQPINRIVTEVSTITELNLAQRLDEGNNKDELSKLAQAFNELLKRLHGVFHSQRFFIANASHEIKTPITAMTGVIEVALMQDRTQEYYQNILRSTLHNLNRLNRLSGQLLLLAQTSSEPHEKNFRTLRVDDIFWDVKSQLQKAHPEYKIDLLFDLNVDHRAFQLEGDEQLLKIAVQNLVDNGCKYSPEHQVSIHLHSREAGFMTALFENAGNIEREHRDKIFEPFFRARTSRGQDGFGIGLSLVYWIVKLHGGSITVDTGSGSIKFILRLPLTH
jgi:signal transduction histidine kinase